MKEKARGDSKRTLQNSSTNAVSRHHSIHARFTGSRLCIAERGGRGNSISGKGKRSNANLTASENETKIKQRSPNEFHSKWRKANKTQIEKGTSREQQNLSAVIRN